MQLLNVNMQVMNAGFENEFYLLKSVSRYLKQLFECILLLLSFQSVLQLDTYKIVQGVERRIHTI